MPRIKEVKLPVINFGPDRSIDVTDIRAAVEEAVYCDHPCEDFQGCDIAVARDNGYVLTAAYLLSGATEVPALDMVNRALTFNGRVDEWSTAAEEEREDWHEWFDAHATMCEACNSANFDVSEGDTCSNCLEPLSFPMSGEFTLTIDMGSAGMSSPADIAERLRFVAERIAQGNNIDADREYTFHDINGNTVGTYTYES